MDALSRRPRGIRREGKAGGIDPHTPSRPGAADAESWRSGAPAARGRASGPLEPPPVAKRDDEVWTLAMEIEGTGMTASVLDRRGALLAARPGSARRWAESSDGRCSGRPLASRRRFRGSTAYP